MNQKGWTNYGLKTDSVKIMQSIKQGAKYLLISDSTSYEDETIKPFIRNKIGKFKNIDIYKVETASD